MKSQSVSQKNGRKRSVLKSVYDMAYSLFKELVGFILKRFQATRKRSTGTKMKRMKDRRQEKRKTQDVTHTLATLLNYHRNRREKRNKNKEGEDYERTAAPTGAR